MNSATRYRRNRHLQRPCSNNNPCFQCRRCTLSRRRTERAIGLQSTCHSNRTGNNRRCLPSSAFYKLRSRDRKVRLPALRADSSPPSLSRHRTGISSPPPAEVSVPRSTAEASPRSPSPALLTTVPPQPTSNAAATTAGTRDMRGTKNSTRRRSASRSGAPRSHPATVRFPPPDPSVSRMSPAEDAQLSASCAHVHKIGLRRRHRRSSPCRPRHAYGVARWRNFRSISVKVSISLHRPATRNIERGDKPFCEPRERRRDGAVGRIHACNARKNIRRCGARQIFRIGENIHRYIGPVDTFGHDLLVGVRLRRCRWRRGPRPESARSKSG